MVKQNISSSSILSTDSFYFKFTVAVEGGWPQVRFWLASVTQTPCPRLELAGAQMLFGISYKCLLCAFSGEGLRA